MVTGQSLQLPRKRILNSAGFCYNNFIHLSITLNVCSDCFILSESYKEPRLQREFLYTSAMLAGAGRLYLIQPDSSLTQHRIRQDGCRIKINQARIQILCGARLWGYEAMTVWHYDNFLPRTRARAYDRNKERSLLLCKYETLVHLQIFSLQ